METYDTNGREQTGAKQNRKKRMNRKRSNNNDKRLIPAFDTFHDDYVDFGALIGKDGAFSWHANYQL